MIKALSLDNACVVAALRDLLGDQEWAHPHVVATIARHGGYPSALNADLEQVAPVRWIGNCTIGFDFAPPRIKIEPADGTKPVILGDGDSAIICRRTSPGRGHAECVSVSAAIQILKNIADGQENSLYGLIVSRPTERP